MKRSILFCLAATVAFAASAAPQSHKLKVVEYASATSFEYDVRAKSYPGDYAGPYATVWNRAMGNCDTRGGYVTEYHDGFKRSYVDTREGGVRVNAYATCRVDDAYANAPVAHVAEDMPTPIATLVSGNGIAPTTGLAQASGEPHAAYEAVRALVYQTCLDQRRRVRFMSTHVDNRSDATPQVEARFACNSGLESGNQND